MKKIIILFVSLLTADTAIFSQAQYEVSTDSKNGEKIMKGIISRSILENEPSFTWYAENQKIYAPDESAVTALRNNKDSLELIVFMGTWCEDSHFVIPRFFSLIDKSGFPNEKVTLLGADRDKKTLSHLAEALNIKNVPTIIVMKNGKELGRVIEYGRDGQFDKELGEVITMKGAANTN
jgi:thiol-disulfide isomerase/thioredoxin